MLSGEGMQGRKTVKTTIDLISKSNFALRAAHFFCTFLCRYFARLQRETSRNLFMEEMSYAFIFSLHWCPLAFLILSPPLQNFYVVLPTILSPLFFISRSRSLPLFFSFSFAGLQPTLSFSLSFLLYIPNLWT